MSDLPLSSLAEINPKTLVPAEIGAFDPVSFIPMSDVSESGNWTVHQERSLRSVSSGFTFFQDGDILVAKITPCLENGKGAHALGLRNGIGFGSTEFHVLRAKTSASPRFLFHVTQWKKFRHAAEGQMVGSAGQQRVPRKFFDEFRISDLALEEQGEIANVLDTLDTTIRETEAIIAKLKAVKQGMLHDLLTRGIDANGELRPPQPEAPHLYKQSPLGWIPKDWGCAPLREYASVTVAYVGPTNPFYTDQEHGVLFLRTGNITDDGIDLSDVRWVTKAFHFAQRKSALQEGDVVVSRVGYTGTASVVSGLGDVNAANMIIIRPMQMLNPQWVRRLFGADAYIKQVSGFTAGSAQPVLNIDLVYRLITPLPPTSEQAPIIERLNACDFRIKSERAELAAMSALKIGLMDDLLAGRVRVTPLLAKEGAA